MRTPRVLALGLTTLVLIGACTTGERSEHGSQRSGQRAGQRTGFGSRQGQHPDRLGQLLRVQADG